MMRVVLLVTLLSSCAPSEDEIQKEFDSFVSAHNACEQDEDCVLIMPGCPLGCWTAVNVDAAGEATRLARELIEDYESAGRACAYGCVASCGARCSDKACVRIEACTF